MFVNNSPLGLGISLDCYNNFEIGFYKEKKVQIYGVNHMNLGDKYIGGYLNNSYHGPGVLYCDDMDNWIFGTFYGGDTQSIQLNRAGPLSKEHYCLNGHMEYLIYSAFGNLPHLKKKL